MTVPHDLLMAWIDSLPLSEAINAAIEAKQGDKCFALFYVGPMVGGPWMAEIGNPSHCVMLGEIGGEVSATGDYPEAAVRALLRKLHGNA